MNKTIIGLIFIFAGLAYASFTIDKVYTLTLGWLVQNSWIKPPPPEEEDGLRKIIGRKPTILLYASGLIIIGIFIIWNQ